MPKSASEVLPDNLDDHPSVKAWRQIEPDGHPHSIEVLKPLRRKSGVYRLRGLGPNDSAVIAKRCPAPIASVEQVIYETLPQRLPLPAVPFYGSVPDQEGEFRWLFLGDAGPHEYSWDRADHRALAARWLAALHCASPLGDLEALLPKRGLDHYLGLLRFARPRLLAHAENPVLSGEEQSLLRTVAGQCEVIESHWDEVETFHERVPRTLVHGDFVDKNLRVLPGATGPALLVFDWEMAGWGVPATDLAHIDRCARPDLDTYQQARRQHRSAVDLGDAERMMRYGSVLRMVNQIHWEAYSMKDDTYRFLVGPLVRLRQYEPELASALRALDWTLGTTGDRVVDSSQ